MAIGHSFLNVATCSMMLLGLWAYGPHAIHTLATIPSRPINKKFGFRFFFACVSGLPFIHVLHTGNERKL